jgi:hypothetical protein
MICNDSYASLSAPRESNKKGGGVALLFKRTIKASKLVCHTLAVTFEYLACLTALESCSILVCIIYRPPQTSVKTFLEEFSDFLFEISHHENILITGDFNIDLSAVSGPGRLFMELIESYNLEQHVYFATNQSNHILDLVLTRQEQNFFCFKCDS